MWIFSLANVFRILFWDAVLLSDLPTLTSYDWVFFNRFNTGEGWPTIQEMCTIYRITLKNSYIHSEYSIDLDIWEDQL